MAALLVRLQAWTRSQWRRCLVTGVLIGAIVGVAMGLAAGTRRTDSAPDRYTAWAGGDPSLVIVQLSGRPLTDQTERLPGVTRASALAFVTAFLRSPTDGSIIREPNPFAGDPSVVGAHIVAGREADPARPDEFVVNESFAALLQERFGTVVGDHFQVGAYDQAQVAANDLDSDAAPNVAGIEATLVGIVATPSDFDDPSPTMVFPATFMDAHPDVGVVQTLIAVYVADGAQPAAVVDAFHLLPDGAGAYNVPTRVVSSAARRAVRFQVTALWMVTAVAALSAAVMVMIVISRALRAGNDERSALVAIGWTHRSIAIERAAEGAVIGVVGAMVAAAVSVAVTAAFPLGVLRTFEPHPGARVDGFVIAAGILALFAVIIATAAASTRGSGDPARSAPPPRRMRRSPFAAAGVALSTGAHLATSGPSGGRRSLGGLMAGAVAVAGIVGSVIVGSSVDRIVTRPARWGVDYDQLYGNPYVAADADIVGPALRDPLVSAVSGATIGSISLDGHDVSMFAVDTVRGDLGSTIIEGRAPEADDEIALGAEVVRRLGTGIGDVISATGPDGGTADVRVVGIAVTPDSAGNGASMTFAGYAALTPSASENLLLVDFVPNAPDDAAAQVDAAEAVPGLLVKPASVRALERVTTAPLLLGAFLGGLLVLTCGYVLALSVRARRMDLAVLRALGADARQLRGIVHWQATILAATVVVIGIPTGVVIGRWVVRLLTQALGIVPGAEVPLLALAGTAVGAIVAANLLALLPARRAARITVTALVSDR